MKDKLIKLIYLSLIVVYAVSFYMVRTLPEVSEINEDLLKEPVQTETNRDKFSFNYRETEYEILPQADYELYGLVVSKNNINAWYNYYHDENTVNLKDLCVVWGDNVANGSYRDKNIKFKSGEWTCYYSWNGRLENKFYPFKLSNNHLLSSSAKIQDIIRDVNIGDQIYIKGALVDYREKGMEWYRMTSLSREDENQTSRSGGACEVFYVDDIKILETNQFIWNFIQKWILKLFLVLIILQIIFFFIKHRKKIF